MKNHRKILIKHIEDKVVIVIAEDLQYVKKLESDFEISIDFLVIYKGRRIISIINNSVSILHLLKRPKVVISEYFNSVPRFFGVLFGAKTLSIIYGVLNSNNFQRRKFFLKKLREPLFADIFFVVNRRATFETLELVHGKKVKFFLIPRKIDSIVLEGNYTLWISQCWEEIGYHEIERIQRICKSKLEARTELLIVQHPRDAEGKYGDTESSSIITCLSGVFDYIKKHGPPSMIYGLTSSALLELKDYNLNVTRVTSEIIEAISNFNKDLLKLNSIHIDEL